MGPPFPWSFTEQSNGKLKMKACTFDDLLNDGLITVTEKYDDIGMFVDRIGSHVRPVTIELGRFMTGVHKRFELNHAIKAPLRASPYCTNLPLDHSPCHALHPAINGLTSWYRDAVEKGPPIERNCMNFVRNQKLQ